MALIEVNHVTKEYKLGQLQMKSGLRRLFASFSGARLPERPTFKALDNVDFKVERGEVLGIIGENGAGKSTLLKILSRISVPSRGTVKVGGKVAPLIEVGAGLIGDLTGRENIYLNAVILGMRRAEIKKRFDEIVAFAELEEFIDTPLKRYSSGMAVRLAFSIATSVDSDILIVDEVLAVGDVAFQRKCLDRMEELIVGGDRTVLVVGHNIRQLERMCSRMLFMQHGQIVLDSNPAEVCKAFFEEAQRKISTQALADTGEFRPTHDMGTVTVRSIDLIGSRAGQTGPEIPIHGSLRLRITLQARRRIPRAEIVIGGHTPDMVHVFSMSSALSAGQPDLPEGVTHVECAIPDLPLRPGQYNLRVGIFDQMHNLLWYAENMRPFRVVADQIDITRIPQVGLTHLKCEWKIDAQAPAEAASLVT
jgi:ABC-type polysaccharide/polyol phosphate transport system ATPase subunit